MSKRASKKQNNFFDYLDGNLWSLTNSLFFEKMIVFKEGMTMLQERLLLTPKDILKKSLKSIQEVIDPKRWINS